jgi:hypothetical protein
VGEIYANPGEALGVKPATEAEREAEWKQVGSAALSQTPLPRPGSGGPHGPGGFPFDGDHQRGGSAPKQVQDARIAVAISGIKARIADIQAHPAKDREGAIKQAEEIANLQERIKALENSDGGGKSAPQSDPNANAQVIADIKKKIAELEALPEANFGGAEKKQLEIAKWKERLKAAESMASEGGDKK